MSVKYILIIGRHYDEWINDINGNYQEISTFLLNMEIHQPTNIYFLDGLAEDKQINNSDVTIYNCKFDANELDEYETRFFPKFDFILFDYSVIKSINKETIVYLAQNKLRENGIIKVRDCTIENGKEYLKNFQFSSKCALNNYDFIDEEEFCIYVNLKNIIFENDDMDYVYKLYVKPSMTGEEVKYKIYEDIILPELLYKFFFPLDYSKGQLFCNLDRTSIVLSHSDRIRDNYKLNETKVRENCRLNLYFILGTVGWTKEYFDLYGINVTKKYNYPLFHKLDTNGIYYDLKI